jgi:hypothetical protein
VTFRAARHGRWPGAAENERVELVREGLAQYTATVVATPSPAAARADAIAELDGAANGPSLVRTFAYPTGTAYGILLEEWSPGWTRRFQPTDDLARLVATAAGVEAGDPDEAARRYDGDAIRTREARREADRAARVASLRERFVTGPVLILPNANGSFLTVDVTPIPEAGTVYPRMRVSGPWGELEADWALRTVDRSQLVVPLPMTVDGATLKGEDWIARLAPGWAVRPAPREGDRMVVRVAP